MKTPQKLTIEVKKPRNPLISTLFQLKSGSHQKSNKTLRQKGKRELDRVLHKIKE